MTPREYLKSKSKAGYVNIRRRNYKVSEEYIKYNEYCPLLYDMLENTLGSWATKKLEETTSLSFLKEIESLLEIIVDNDSIGIDVERWAKKQDTVACLKTVSMWYCGLLDPHFYYGERNGETFISDLCDWYCNQRYQEEEPEH